VAKGRLQAGWPLIEGRTGQLLREPKLSRSRDDSQIAADDPLRQRKHFCSNRRSVFQIVSIACSVHTRIIRPVTGGAMPQTVSELLCVLRTVDLDISIVCREIG
jgi:hypothetical protein